MQIHDYFIAKFVPKPEFKDRGDGRLGQGFTLNQHQ